MNKGIMTARLTGDATIQKNQEPSKNRAQFSIAVDRAVKTNGKEADFFTCIAFGRQADYIEKGMADGRYLKGCEVEVEGQIQLYEYKGADGSPKAQMQIIIASCHSKIHPSRLQQNGNQRGYAQNGQDAYGYGAPYNANPMPAPNMPQQGGYMPNPNGPQGGYTPGPNAPQGNRPAPNAPQGGYTPAPAQPQQGNYMPNQSNPQGGYTQAPNAPQGGYTQAPNAPQGGYAQAPNAPQGNRPAPNAPQGGYTPASAQPQQGNYMPNPNGPQGGFMPAPNAPQGGYMLAPNAPQGGR